MNEVKLVWNKGTGSDIALEVPTKMSGGALQTWVYANSERIKKAKEEMRDRGLDEYVLEVMPDRSYTPKIGEHAPEEVKFFEKRISLEFGAGHTHIMFTDSIDDDHEWNSGFVEYLIDRYEYAYMGGNVIVHLNKPKDVEEN